MTENLFLVLAAGIGFAGGFVPTGVFSAGVEVVGDERVAGMAMAVIQIGQNSGMLLGPLVFGWAVQSGGGLADRLLDSSPYQRLRSYLRMGRQDEVKG